MIDTETLLKRARKLPKASHRPTAPGTYTPLEPVVRELDGKGYSARKMAALLVEWGAIAQAEHDRTLHGIYRILRRHRRSSMNP